MRIGFTTYPVAFQRPGGLEVQMRETAEALRRLGHDVRIVELYRERLCDFDLIHHFSLKHSSLRILQYAKLCGIPVVATPLVNPIKSRLEVARVRSVTSILRRLLGREFSGYWDDLYESLRLCDAVFPLTEREAAVISRFAPAITPISHVVPNGVSERFFSAKPHPVTQPQKLPESFVLLPSSIEPRKNQEAVVSAAADIGVPVVMIGPVLDDRYFRQCLKAGGDGVYYLGEIAYCDESLPTVFAAARCVVLFSWIEPFGLVPFEALAAGTPAILTTQSGVSLPSIPPYFYRISPNDPRGLRQALSKILAAPSNVAACQEIAAPYSWDLVAQMLQARYRAILA